MQYFNEAANMKMGAASFEELSAWPDLMLIDFMQMPLGRARLARVRGVLEWGLVVHFDCSGKMTPEAVLQMLDIALRRQGFHLPTGWLALWRACDSATQCQDFIRAASKRPMHLFVDLMGRLPLMSQLHLKHLRPLAGATPNQREIAHKAQVVHLEGNKINLSTAFTARNCLFHPEQDCRVNFTIPDTLDPATRPLTIAIVGLPCRPFSCLGNREQLAHTDMEAIALFKIEVLKGYYDIVVIEEDKQFPERIFAYLIPPHYVLRKCIVGPQDQGKPVRRTRFWGAALSQKRLVWIGPETNDVLQQDFLSLFGAAVQLDGDVYAKKDNVEGIAATVHGLAQKAGKHLTPDQLAACDNWQTFLPQDYRATFDAASAVWESGDGDHRAVGMSGSLLADLSQAPHRMREGPWLPTIARSSMLCCVSAHHVLTPAELDFAMGWPSIINEHNRIYAEALDLNERFHATSAAKRRQLSGNGMDLGQVMAWLLYIFSNVVRRSVLERLEVPLGADKPVDSDDERCHQEHSFSEG